MLNLSNWDIKLRSSNRSFVSQPKKHFSSTTLLTYLVLMPIFVFVLSECKKKIIYIHTHTHTHTHTHLSVKTS